MFKNLLLVSAILSVSAISFANASTSPRPMGFVNESGDQVKFELSSTGPIGDTKPVYVAPETFTPGFVAFLPKSEAQNFWDHNIYVTARVTKSYHGNTDMTTVNCGDFNGHFAYLQTYYFIAKYDYDKIMHKTVFVCEAKDSLV